MADTSSITSTPRRCRASCSAGRSRTEEEVEAVRINLASVLVDDQDKALRFYTETLGFVKKTDVPVGEARWLTVVSPDDPDGTELLLEPLEMQSVTTAVLDDTCGNLIQIARQR